MVMSSWRGRVVAVAAAAVISVGAVIGVGGGGSVYVATPTPTSTPDPGLPDLGIPSCAVGAVNVTTNTAAVSNLSSGNDVCVTASIGTVALPNQTSGTNEQLGTSGSGIIDYLDLDNTDNITFTGRAMQVNIRGGSDHVTLQSCKVGGSGPASGNRAQVDVDALIRGVDTLQGSTFLTVQDCDVGYTLADNGGNSGFCFRVYGDNNDAIYKRNRIHDCASDGFQGVGGDRVVIDRNEIGPVGTNPGSTEHSDIVQLSGNGASTEVTNNWMHEQGYYDDGGGLDVTGNAGATYIHGGESDTILYDNNLVEDSQGQVEVCGLGEPPDATTFVRGGLTMTHNTFYDLARVGGIGGFRWDCTSGSPSNVVTNNVSAHSNGIGDMETSGSSGAATWSNNVGGNLASVTLDSDGNCTSSNCNPGGGVVIGFRKPTGVHW